MSKFYFNIFVVNLVIFAILFAYGDFKLLINVELGALGSIITTLGSFHGYRKMVDKRSKDLKVDEDEEDPQLEKIEDPFGLYDDDEIIEDDTLDVKEFIKEEKKRMKMNWGDIFSTFKANVSFFRIVGYIVIIYSFFYLLDKNLLHPIGFLLGISLVPVTLILRSKKIV